jgi:hypothetical protein
MINEPRSHHRQSLHPPHRGVRNSLEFQRISGERSTVQATAGEPARKQRRVEALLLQFAERESQPFIA